MRQNTPDHVQVKAAGGVRDVETMIAVKEIGATRVGSSSTQKLMDAFRKQLGMKQIAFEGITSEGY